MRAAWRLVRIWYSTMMRTSRRPVGRRARRASSASHPAGWSATRPIQPSGNHLDDADEWRSAVGGSWFLPRD